jgi:hypothetical protein
VIAAAHFADENHLPQLAVSPRTPVGILRIVTLAGRLTTFLGSLRSGASFCFFILISTCSNTIKIAEGQFRPDLVHQLQR